MLYLLTILLGDFDHSLFKSMYIFLISFFKDKKKRPVKGPVGTPKNPAKKPIPDPNEQDVKLFTGPLYFHPEANINVAIFENSYHSFDTDSKVHKKEDAYNFSECMFKLTSEGHVLMNYINVPMSNAFLQKIGFSFCVTRGVYSGGNPEARKKSFSLAKSFIKKTLLK